LLLTPVFYVLIRRMAKRQAISGDSDTPPARIASAETH